MGGSPEVTDNISHEVPCTTLPYLLVVNYRSNAAIFECCQISGRLTPQCKRKHQFIHKNYSLDGLLDNRVNDTLKRIIRELQARGENKMPGKMIEINAQDGGCFNGYLAIPECG